MGKDALVSLLNTKTKDYLGDASPFASLGTTRIDGREIYEFDTKVGGPRRIRYILDGNRVLIFLATASDKLGVEDSLKLFNSVKHFSVRKIAEERMETATQKSFPQSPAIKFVQSDVEHNNLKGHVKSVKVEADDVPILVGTAERRIVSDDFYDTAGNLLKTYWFEDAGYPTSVRFYGFIDGARVSDSEELSYDTIMRLDGAAESDVKSPPPDPRYEYRYEYSFDSLKRLTERKEYDNKGAVTGVYTFTYKDNLLEEKWFAVDGKLNSTKRRRVDKNGNELTYEFWWYNEKDKEVDTYDYKKFDQFGNWTERQVVKKITDRGLTRTRTSTEFRTIAYYEK
jgi:hypothetical protein